MNQAGFRFLREGEYKSQAVVSSYFMTVLYNRKLKVRGVQLLQEDGGAAGGVRAAQALGPGGRESEEEDEDARAAARKVASRTSEDL